MSKRVLVVEDDEDIREMVLMVLEDSGYEVLEAQHGRAALKLLREPDHVSLLLLDMRMPVMNGWQFTEAWHNDPALQGSQDTPVIVITAAADAQRWAAEIGAQGYLAKPFGAQQIRRAVAVFLGDDPA